MNEVLSYINCIKWMEMNQYIQWKAAHSHVLLVVVQFYEDSCGFRDLPAVLHVGGFVHADGQFDLQLGVLAVFGNDHAVKLRLLRPIGGRVQHHLKGGVAYR